MKRWLCITVFALTGPMAWSAMTIQGYQSKLHDRFYVGGDRAFIGEAYNWSGVSSSGNWAVMVSPSYFLCSFHAEQSAGLTVTFNQDNNPAGTAFTYTVDSYRHRLQIAGGPYAGLPGDIELRRFTTAVDASITKYPIAVSASENDFVNSTLWVYGADNRVGRNELNNNCVPTVPNFDYAFDTFPSPTNATYCSVFDYDSPGGVGVDEAGLQTGDSNAPSFVVIGGQLALEGIHLGVDTSVAPVAAYDAFVPYYWSQINTEIRAASGNLEAPTSLSLAIPEPAGLLLLAAAAGTTLRRRTRQAA